MLLVNYNGKSIYIGQTSRWPSNDPTQEIRECLIFDAKNGSGLLGLVELSGQGSGHTLCYFPEESFSAGTKAISRDWLIENFSFVEQNVDIKQVHVGKERDFTELTDEIFR